MDTDDRGSVEVFAGFTAFGVLLVMILGAILFKVVSNREYDQRLDSWKIACRDRGGIPDNSKFRGEILCLRDGREVYPAFDY